MLEKDALQPLYDIHYSQRLHAALAVCGLCGLYIHHVVRKLAPSHAAVAAAAPVFLINMLLPLLFSNGDTEVLSRGTCCMCIPFLGNIKLFGLCCNRGPLAGKWGALETVLLYMLPIVPRQECADGGKRGRLADDAGSPSKVSVSFLINTALLAAVTSIMSAPFPLPPMVKYYLYGLGLYGFLTMAMQSTAAVLIALLDLHIVPAFDKPWIAGSVADFWGRRWNNTISLTLRTIVYDPVMEGHIFNRAAAGGAAGSAGGTGSQKGSTADTTGSTGSTGGIGIQKSSTGSTADAQGSTGSTSSTASLQQQQQHISLTRKALATAAIFTVSGLEHEFFLWQIAREGEYHPGWWFMFFFVQFPVMILEGLLLKRLKAANIIIPRVVRTVTTTLVLMLTAHVFFFPPVDTYSGIAPRLTGAVNRNVVNGLAALQGWGHQVELATWAHVSNATAGTGA